MSSDLTSTVSSSSVLRYGYESCHAPDAGLAFSQPEAAAAIFICPNFWRLPRSIPVSDDCHKASKTPNVFDYSFRYFGESQSNIILHELIHVYRSPATYLDPEVCFLNDCIGLDARSSANNIANYEHYIMGTYGSSTTSFPPSQSLIATH